MFCGDVIGGRLVAPPLVIAEGGGDPVINSQNVAKWIPTSLGDDSGERGPSRGWQSRMSRGRYGGKN